LRKWQFPGTFETIRHHVRQSAHGSPARELGARAEEAVALARPAAALEAARALVTLGMIRRRARRRRDAADALDRATSAFEAIGATVWAERAHDERSRVGLRRARGLELTDTERSVAELVARGHTSREVAGMLFMSVRTVDAHLSRIYRKLGVRSRTELARLLPSEGPVEAGGEQI
jgi:DNA-binding CsgD family transcriptional regulator